ncbi:6434_t:CDS:10 [Acaulospora morrowiae]|uniref:6434_t:CDS:1 n=1 Tax=Acaulospora morrowiae TaxID=94023 RepID=A0A9N8YPH7_9GLOM|nr:6434_t:CDS:10 [Acaulospora morrowiae]
MSANHPPPIPPKPSSGQGRSNENGAPNMNQLLNLIDSEIANKPQDNWTPANVNSNDGRPYPQNFYSTSSASYNAGVSSHNYPQSYNLQGYVPGQSYDNNAVPQNYGGQPYYQENQYVDPYYYSMYPQEDWSVQAQNYSESYMQGNFPVPMSSPIPPPSSNQSYPAMSTSSSHGYNGTYVAEGTYSQTGTTPVGYASPQLVMPDFHTYVDNSSRHQNDPSSLSQRNPQAPLQHSYPQEPYDAYPTDQDYGQKPCSNGSSSKMPSQDVNQSMWSPVLRQPSKVLSTSKTTYLNGMQGIMNPALLSNIAVAFRAAVNLGTHMKGALEYPDSFTGKDTVSTIYSLLPNHLNRQVALSMARSLESQLYFHSINWSTIAVVKDTEDEVYQFLDEGPYSPTALEWDEDFPTGVFPIASKCYSPRCGFEGKGCYSRTCPNYVRSAMSTSPQDNTWSGTVPKEIQDTVDKEEKKRQEIIFETIYTEEDYIKDLDLLENLFKKGLRDATPPIIPPTQLDDFIQAVFFNVFKIRAHNQKMLERLRKRQKENYVVQSIGDIFCDSSMEFGNDYVDYNGHFPIADHAIKTMKMRNPEFKRFLEDCSRKPEARRLDFRHFVQRPTTRLQRYTLFLEQIMKHTSNDNPDKGLLEGALQTVRNLCKDSDSRVHDAEQRLKILELETKLIKKNGDPCTELKLMDINRQLLFKGTLYKKNPARFEWLELFVFLFDHYLVMTKKKRGADGDEKYIISKKPIPLEMLIIDSSNDNLTPRNTRKKPTTQNPQIVTDLEGTDNRTSNPFNIEHVGRHGGLYQLFADSANTKKMWKEKIQDAQTKLQLKELNNHVFELFTMNDSTFKLGQTGSSSSNTVSRGKVNCSVPFVTPEKRNMVAIGTEEGVWMGFGGEMHTFRKVLAIGNVMQMAVIENYGIFVVLVDRVLWAYSLDALIPSSNSSSHGSAVRQRLCNSNSNVQYFNVGTIKDKTLLIFMRKKGIESLFKVLEPVQNVGANSEKVKSSSSRRLGGLMSSRHDWFKEYKQFYVPSESYSINFLRSKLCVVCARGFEIMNLENLHSNTIPDFMQPSFATIARQCDGSKPLGMFRLSDNEFLLCYAEIFFRVDKYGELSRKNVVEWEGHPDAVALQLPYIIGYNSSFIEIRDVETGELIQPILGRNIRCLTFSNWCLPKKEELNVHLEDDEKADSVQSFPPCSAKLLDLVVVLTNPNPYFGNMISLPLALLYNPESLFLFETSIQYIPGEVQKVVGPYSTFLYGPLNWAPNWNSEYQGYHFTLGCFASGLMLGIDSRRVVRDRITSPSLFLCLLTPQRGDWVNKIKKILANV